MPSPRYWREIPSRYRLEAVRCRACGKVAYPPRRVCPACRGTDLEKTALSPRGRVVTSTVIHVPPTDLLMQAPYAMAVVETPEGARLMVQVVDCDPAAVEPGMEVELEFRLIRKEGHGGILCYGHKGVPAAASSSA
jgi:scaffold protein (connect acetoacetyl-CoA thiolase and HMG-CoA synthase)